LQGLLEHETSHEFLPLQYPSAATTPLQVSPDPVVALHLLPTGGMASCVPTLKQGHADEG
jgi:hypothetical protein